MSTNITYFCPECDHEFNVSVSPIVPAQTYGDPEKCHPQEGGECIPDECPNCGIGIDANVCHEEASQVEEDIEEE